MERRKEGRKEEKAEGMNEGRKEKMNERLRYVNVITIIAQPFILSLFHYLLLSFLSSAHSFSRLRQ